MFFHFLFLAVAAILLGCVGKYSDLLNEHGLQPQFKEPPILSGCIWGSAGIAILFLSPIAGISYVAHILYWFLRVKLEYPNHALAGVIILLGALCFQAQFYALHSTELFLLFLGYALTGYLQSYLKKHKPSLRPFLRLRLRIYFIPFFHSLYQWSIDPLFANCFGMLACEIVTYCFKNKKFFSFQKATSK